MGWEETLFCERQTAWVAGSKVRLLSGTQCVLLITHRSEAAEQQLSPGVQLPPEWSCSSRSLWVEKLCHFAGSRWSFKSESEERWKFFASALNVLLETRKAELTGEMKGSFLWTHMRWSFRRWRLERAGLKRALFSPSPPKKTHQKPS